MAANISMEGVGVCNAVTMLASEALITAVGNQYDSAIGKPVTLTGNNEVGYGTENDPVIGIIQKYEYDPVQGETVVAVQIRGFREGVPITATAAKQPAVKNVVCVDGKGALVKAPASGETYAAAAPAFAHVVCTAVDTASKTATVFLC